MWPAVPPISSVALVLSPAIGDSLLMMTIARNLQQSGIAVTVFGRQIHALRDWFPDVATEDDLSAGDLAARLGGFDRVIQMHRNKPFAGLEQAHPRVILLDHICRVRSSHSMADRLARFCQDEFGLASAHKSNGMTAPAGLQHRKYPLRVAIHPTASTADKCWLPSRFIRLAIKLRELGFSPEFVVAPQARRLDSHRTSWPRAARSGFARQRRRVGFRIRLVYRQRLGNRPSGVEPAYSHAVAVHAPRHCAYLAAGLGGGAGADRQHFSAHRISERALLEIHVVRQAGLSRVRPDARQSKLRMTPALPQPCPDPVRCNRMLFPQTP
jgi:hypothetical protein